MIKPQINIGTLDDIEFPDILYKYRTWDNPNNRRSIINREVYLASPKDFQDKFDCKIPIRYDLMNEKEAYLFYERLQKNSKNNLNRKKREKNSESILKRKSILTKKSMLKMRKYIFENILIN